MSTPFFPYLIVGGGPAGLMSAETLGQAALFEAMPSAGRKFLRAGVGGLNLTHSEALEQFLQRYRPSAPLEAPLRAFGPQQVIEWARALGVETFVGSSGRVFPKEMKASPLLRTWLKRLNAAGTVFHFSHRWSDIQADKEANWLLTFDTPQGQVQVKARQVLFSLGGGSWPRLGSTGGWVQALTRLGLEIAPLRPANCGFECDWSEHFRQRFDGAPLKTVGARFGAQEQIGEFIITREGVEGSLIYAFSAALRDAIEAQGQASLLLDLAPGWTEEKLTQRLALPRGSRSLASHLQKSVGLTGVKAGLLWETQPREVMLSAPALAAAIKSLPLRLLKPRPLAEAISSAGGLRFEGLTSHFMAKSHPGLFFAGEMLNWEAPTGGYLLTACLSTARWAAQAMLEGAGTSIPKEKK